jgi:pimeloyl-ACP methyl ester carboxylesterase
LSLAARRLPRVAGFVAEQIFVSPRRRAMRSSEARVMRQATPLAIAGSDTSAWTWGAGPSVLLVHGWQGRASQLAAFVAPLVRAGYRVVAFDAPAHGASSGARTTLVHFARAVEAVARAAGPLAAVVAHSLGAAATTIALSRGMRAERVVFLAPMADVPAALARFSSYLGLDKTARHAFVARIERRTATPLEAIDGLRLATRLRVPLLVLHDETDAEIPLSESRALTALWHGARLVTTRGLGHRALVHDLDTVTRAVAFVVGAARPASSSFEELLNRELYVPEERPEANGTRLLR